MSVTLRSRPLSLVSILTALGPGPPNLVPDLKRQIRGLLVTWYKILQSDWSKFEMLHSE